MLFMPPHYRATHLQWQGSNNPYLRPAPFPDPRHYYPNPFRGDCVTAVSSGSIPVSGDATKMSDLQTADTPPVGRVFFSVTMQFNHVRLSAMQLTKPPRMLSLGPTQL
jgi:hypothetical protein